MKDDQNMPLKLFKDYVKYGVRWHAEMMMKYSKPSLIDMLRRSGTKRPCSTICLAQMR